MKDYSSERTGGVWDQPDRSFLAALMMEEALDELYEKAVPLPGDAEAQDLENELALLNLMESAPVDDRPVYLWIRCLPNAPDHTLDAIHGRVVLGLRVNLGLEITGTPLEHSTKERALEVKGFHARALLVREAGTHLVLPKTGGVQPVRVCVTDSLIPPSLDRFDPVLRLYPSGKPMIDIRTGLVGDDAMVMIRNFILTALPRA